MSFREALSLGAGAYAGLPARALAGWVLSLLGLALSVAAVRVWLTGPPLAGRHRSLGSRSRAARARRRHHSTAAGGCELPPVTTAAGDAKLPALFVQDGDLPAGTLPPGGEPAVGAPAAAAEPAGETPPGGADKDAQLPGLPAPGTSSAPDARQPAGDDGPAAGAGPGAAAGTGAGAGAGPDLGREQPPRRVAAELSPAALRLLGARRQTAGPAGAARGLIQRLEVALGSYHIEVLLAEAPAGDRTGRTGKGPTWIASAPYLAWTPLPHDFPADGVAFVCVGAGEEGCLFLDLAAAPGAISLGGDQAAATRLAESLAHQLCAGPAAAGISVVIVGDALPPPPPLGAKWVASVADLPGRLPDPADQVEMVFCRVESDDVFTLARYVASAPYRVVPLVLADLPDAPWSFTARPSPHVAAELQTVVS